MKCISKLITSLASLLATATIRIPAQQIQAGCVAVEGARITAGELAPRIPAFREMPASSDLGASPAGTLLRIFSSVQLAGLLPPGRWELPARICVERKRSMVEPESWLKAVESALRNSCEPDRVKVTIVETPRFRLPKGELVFSRSGILSGRDGVQLWRGTLVLPEKTSIPIWVRAEIRTLVRLPVLREPLTAGSVINTEDYVMNEIWVAPQNGMDLCPEAGTWSPVGLVTKTDLAAGTPLRQELLRKPPTIPRGTAVEVEVVSGGARLRLPATSESDAELGQPVRLINNWNGKHLVGRVTGKQKAKVE